MKQGSLLCTQVLFDTLLQLSGDVSPEEILSLIARQVGQAMMADRCSFLRLEPDINAAQIVTAYDDSRFRGFILDLAKYPELQASLESGSEFCVFEADKAPILQELVGQGLVNPSSSILVVPLRFENSNWGTFFLRVTRSNGAFSEEEVSFCRGITLMGRNLLEKAYHSLETETAFIRASRARRRYLRKDYNKTRLLQLIAHEFKTPLSILNGYMHLMRDPSLGGLTLEQEDIIAESRQLCEMLLDFLRSVMNFTVLDEGDLAFSFGHASVEALLLHILSGVQKEAEAKGIRIQTRIEPELPMVKMDTDKMTFAVANLIFNAMRYTPAGGRILIQASRRDLVRSDHRRPFLVISVTDTGPGVEPGQIPFLFSTRKAGRVHVTLGDTTGLGLPISRRIVSGHGGIIGLDRRYKKGARFYVALPIHTHS